MPSQVLAIDDDPLLLELLHAHLESAGYAVIEARDGNAGLVALRAGGPRIAFIDYDMPGMSGIEFCRRVRADSSFPFTHLVILTAHADRKLTIAALDAGANDFMTKPFDRGELLARLRAGERAVRLHDEAAHAARLQSERNHLSDAVKAMEQVLAVVAHELRTPIASLGIMTEYLLNPAARGTEEWERFLKQMNTGVRHLAQVVNDLLEAARLNSGQTSWNWSRFALRPICDEAIEHIRPLLMSREVSISVQLHPEYIELDGDSAAVLRLLLNLLNNAVRHTQAGSIRLEAELSLREEGQWIELSVIDTGEGMTPEILARLGQPFMLNRGATGANYVGGTGLGVAICRRIAEAHGGRITVTSAPGRGTCVTVFLRADLVHPAPLDSGGIFVAPNQPKPSPVSADANRREVDCDIGR